jgi:UDP-N-acetylmuramoyl-L-alanyl-D-glutamate--2,6-diaminopimelate ligase
MQIVEAAADITVVVDYAHTPDALRSALVGLRHHFSGKLRCVFGAGGNRDVGKRPLMGEIAQRHADVVVLTDDNPRFEDGDSIIAQIASGFDDSAAVMRERDRRLAIERAILGAQPGDIVLLAGKGHEPYQEIRGERVPFDDVACALESLQRRALKVPL